MVFTLVCIAFGFNIREATHISGRANWQADILSRLVDSESVENAMTRIGFANAPVVKLEQNRYAMELLTCCKPSDSAMGEEGFGVLRASAPC
jgi:hypothetical protein